MAGRPVRRAVAQKIVEFGGHEKILEMMAEGRTLTSIAKELEVSKSTLSELYRKPELIQKYTEAKQQSADAWITKGLEAVENATPTNVQVAKLQWDAFSRMAAIVNPAEYSDKSGTTVNVTIGDLHLEALKKRPITIDVTPEADE